MKKFTVIFFFAFASCLPAQQQRIDSLKRVIKTAKEDTIKINAINALAITLKPLDPDTAIIVASEALRLSTDKGYDWGIGKATIYLGLTYYSIGDFYKAMEYYKKALAHYEAMEANPVHEKIRPQIVSQKIKTIGNIGLTYHAQGNYTRSLECFLNALHLSEKAGLSTDAWYSNIGMVYDVQGEYAKAIDHYKKALVINEREKHIPFMIKNLGNLGIVYDEMGNDTLALEYYFKALKLARETKDMKSESINLSNIGVVYQNRDDEIQALEYFLKALKLSEQLGDVGGQAIRLNNIGVIYMSSKKYGMADDCLTRSLKLSEEIGDLEGVSECSENLSKLYERTGKYERSLEMYKKFIAARDTIYNEENTKSQVRLEMGYEFQKKEAMARAEQEKKEAIAQAEAKRQRVLLFSISGFGLLVLGFAVFAYRSFLQKKRANEEISRQKELIEEKQKEILDSIYYARRIQRSLLPTPRYVARILQHLHKN
jgi:tetratricopeptide (TPR) repeat protein